MIAIWWRSSCTFGIGKKAENSLLIELPEYKAPSAQSLCGLYVTEKVKDYLTKAGTTIFIASILMWFILNFGIHGYCYGYQ